MWIAGVTLTPALTQMPGGSNLTSLSTFLGSKRRDRETPGFTARLALNFPAVGDAIEQETLGFTAGGFLHETQIPGRADNLRRMARIGPEEQSSFRSVVAHMK
jgi:hypothetical protein